MKNLEEKFKNMHLLDREERMKLARDLEILRPEFLKPYVPRWSFWKPCKVNVLIVCDGALNYDYNNDFGLDVFLTAFIELEASAWWVNFRVTLAHRGNIINSPNPVVVDHISEFNFATSVNLNDFDQIWLFGIEESGGIEDTEKDAIESYMNGGGGLFATGDHGFLGNAMCGDIVRVKDMRYWADTPNSKNKINEVSMTGRRRNDTNRPADGDATSIWFDNQSDEIPQTIGVRTFYGGLPHPLLSISPRLRPTRIIDVMPDHPHEGECAPETSFTVNGVTIPTQIIATSFVLGGSTTSGGGGKARTVPHCFPSISVWDGRYANAGRIVVDSTWHHFVNTNLKGVKSNIDRPGRQPGLNDYDFIAIRQYYMNIATWITRRNSFHCWRIHTLHDLLKNSQLIEASLDNPGQNRNEISLADLNSIGALAEEILASKFNPAFARSFLLDIMEEYNKDFAELIDPWKPKTKKISNKNTDEYYHSWFNTDLLLYSSIGSGFIALRDDEQLSSDDLDEKGLDRILEVFLKGVDFGFERSETNLNHSIKSFGSILKGRKRK